MGWNVQIPLFVLPIQVTVCLSVLPDLSLFPVPASRRLTDLTSLDIDTSWYALASPFTMQPLNQHVEPSTFPYLKKKAE